LKLNLGPLKHFIKASVGVVESVGFILGVRRGDELEAVVAYRVDNELESPVEFRASPWQVVQAHRVAELYKLEVIALYHTHPACPPTPSHLDLKGMKLWPLVWVIACKDTIKAWRLEDGEVVEVEVV
jgi:proteasome lid subunit RPN8/RPN11